MIFCMHACEHVYWGKFFYDVKCVSERISISPAFLKEPHCCILCSKSSSCRLSSPNGTQDIHDIIETWFDHRSMANIQHHPTTFEFALLCRECRATTWRVSLLPSRETNWENLACLYHGISKLMLDKTLQEQGIVGMAGMLSCTFFSIDCMAVCPGKCKPKRRFCSGGGDTPRRCDN